MKMSKYLLGVLSFLVISVTMAENPFIDGDTSSSAEQQRPPLIFSCIGQSDSDRLFLLLIPREEILWLFNSEGVWVDWAKTLNECNSEKCYTYGNMKKSSDYWFKLESVAEDNTNYILTIKDAKRNEDGQLVCQ